MSLTKLLPVILLMMATGVQASTRDEIERLWNPQGMAVQPAQPAADTSARTEKPAPRWFRLSNGRQVNLADWKVVLFMQGMINSSRFSSMNTLTLKDLPDNLASSGNSLLSMIMQLSMSIGVTIAGRQFPAALVGYDRHHDVAVLQLRGAAGLPAAPIGET